MRAAASCTSAGRAIRGRFYCSRRCGDQRRAEARRASSTTSIQAALSHSRDDIGARARLQLALKPSAVRDPAQDDGRHRSFSLRMRGEMKGRGRVGDDYYAPAARLRSSLASVDNCRAGRLPRRSETQRDRLRARSSSRSGATPRAAAAALQVVFLAADRVEDQKDAGALGSVCVGERCRNADGESDGVRLHPPSIGASVGQPTARPTSPPHRLQNLSKNRVDSRDAAGLARTKDSFESRGDSRTLATKDERHRHVTKCRLLGFDSRRLHQFFSMFPHRFPASPAPCAALVPWSSK